MKGLKTVSTESKQAEIFGRVPLYYSITNDTVSTNKKNDSFYFVTYLIRENTPQDIKEAVNRFLSM